MSSGIAAGPDIWKANIRSPRKKQNNTLPKWQPMPVEKASPEEEHSCVDCPPCSLLAAAQAEINQLSSRLKCEVQMRKKLEEQYCYNLQYQMEIQQDLRSLLTERSSWQKTVFDLETELAANTEGCDNHVLKLQGKLQILLDAFSDAQSHIVRLTSSEVKLERELCEKGTEVEAFLSNAASLQEELCVRKEKAELEQVDTLRKETTIDSLKALNSTLKQELRDKEMRLVSLNTVELKLSQEVRRYEKDYAALHLFSKEALWAKERDIETMMHIEHELAEALSAKDIEISALSQELRTKEVTIEELLSLERCSAMVRETDDTGLSMDATPAKPSTPKPSSPSRYRKSYGPVLTCAPRDKTDTYFGEEGRDVLAVQHSSPDSTTTSCQTISNGAR